MADRDTPPIARTGDPVGARVRRGAPPPPPQGDGRSQVVWASGLNILAGIWLIISPWVLGYRSGDAWWNPVVFGAIVGLLALARVAGMYEQFWVSWLNVVIGGWLFVSAFWLADSARASWNVAISGAVVFFLAVWSAAASEGLAIGGPGASSGGRAARY